MAERVNGQDAGKVPVYRLPTLSLRSTHSPQAPLPERAAVPAPAAVHGVKGRADHPAAAHEAIRTGPRGQAGAHHATRLRNRAGHTALPAVSGVRHEVYATARARRLARTTAAHPTSTRLPRGTGPPAATAVHRVGLGIDTRGAAANHRAREFAAARHAGRAVCTAIRAAAAVRGIGLRVHTSRSVAVRAAARALAGPHDA